jgi:hypothetical protein
MQFKSFMEALKGNQHKLDKNKNGKLDAHDFKLLQKEEDDIEEDVDRVTRADYKETPSGRKSHKEITFKNGEPESDEDKAKSQREQVEIEERSMTDAEMKKREDYVKGMKKNISGFKAKYGERAKDVMYATATKMAMKEETLDEALDPSEIAGNPKMYDASTVKKAYYHKSTSASDKESLARHLDRHHGNKEWRTVKEEVSLEENHLMDYRRYTQAAKNAKAKGDHDIAKDAEEKAAKSASHYTRMTGKKPTFNEAFINGREYASHGLMHPDHAKMGLHQKTGNTVDFYAHGTGDKITGKVTKNDGKSVHIQADKSSGGKLHKFKVTPHLPKQNNEELQMQEQAPVAPTLVKHRIGVTVSDPDHPMVSKRKEKMQKFVVVTHSDNKDGAKKVGEKFYKKRGLIVHDSHHAGMVNEEAKKEDPPFDGPYTKSPGTVKDKSGAVHTPMSRARDLARQAMKKQMKENFDLDISDEQADSLVQASNLEQIDELSKATIGSYIKKAKGSAIGSAQVTGMGSSMTGQKTQDKAERNVQKRASGINKAVDRLTREESNFDEEGNLMAEKLTFSDFIDKLNEQLLEYETKSGVYRHKGSYGSAYQGDADDEDDKPKKPAAPDAPKRGRGRPAGSTGASYKPRSAETKAAAAAKAAATKAANKK